MKSFNFSPSAIGVFMESPLWFYYSYCSEEAEDTKTLACYWKSGNAVHETLEHYHEHRDRDKSISFFDKAWEEKGLYNELDFRGRPLSKGQYLDATIYGMKLIDEDYEVLESELKIELPFRPSCNKKGFLDILAMHDGKLTIMDFKTSASIDTSKKFYNQVLMYAHLYYAKTGKIINHARIEYLKKKQAKAYEFTDEEVINFEEDVLVPIYNTIMMNQDNEFAYELGKFDSPFNSYKKKCQAQADLRRPNAIIAVRQDNKLHFKQGLPSVLKQVVDKYFSYRMQGYQFAPSYKDKRWNGYIKFLKRNTLPFGFKNEFERVLLKYNERAKTNYELVIIDKRDQNVVNAKYQTRFKKSSMGLRYYQEEAIKIALDTKLGIINIGTGGGKSLIASEIIRKTNNRVLFVVNRRELLEQTAETFEDELGVKVGRMIDGNLDVNNQVTICSIQTIVAILSRDDETSKQLLVYLYNVGTCIFDESHNVVESKSYGFLNDGIINAEYILGLTGTSFRNDGATLEMNAVLGFPIYRKSAKELEDEGYLSPVDINFIHVNKRDDEEFKTFDNKMDYHKMYMHHLCEHEVRNKRVINLVKEHRDKEMIIIFCGRIAHGEYLQENIENSFFIHGSVDVELRKKKLQEFKEGKGLVLIGMSSIFSEGIDIPALTMSIDVGSGTSATKVIQKLGRTKRKADDKSRGLFFDFVDEHPLFMKMSKKRIIVLEGEGHKVNIIF